MFHIYAIVISIKDLKAFANISLRIFILSS